MFGFKHRRMCTIKAGLQVEGEIKVYSSLIYIFWLRMVVRIQ